MRKIIIAVVATLAGLAGTAVFARPANPNPIEVEQPDGSKITIILKGDERIKWAETQDGYSLLRGQDGFWEYAAKAENGDMIASGVRLSDNVEEAKSASKGEKHIMFSTAQKQAIFASENSPKIKSGINLRELHKKAGQKSSVNFKMPVIIVYFTDRDSTFGNADFDTIFNLRNMNKSGYAGSVADYFYDNSHGKFQFQADIFGPYRLSQKMAYYGGNNSSGDDKNPKAMVREAVQMAYDNGCDFSEYDADGDGEVDGVHIIFAGCGEEETNESDAIWSHAWDISAVLGGMKINNYSCSGEFRSNRALSGLGAPVHEISHVLGLPDFYDTDYTGNGGIAVTPDAYDIMDGGTYNNGGCIPPQHNAWSKLQLGWNESYILDSACTVKILAANDEERTYIIETKITGEYFVLDNRPESKWDTWDGLSRELGGGLLIFAVDENSGDWEYNCINCNPSRRGFYIKQADGGKISRSRMGEGTPFPGLSENTSFTDSTSPSSRSRNNTATEKPITDISINAKNHVIFNLLGGGDTISSMTPDTVITSKEIEAKGVAQTNTLRLYPNPSSNVITIENAQETIEIFSANGALIKRSKNNKVDLSKQPSGVYIIRSGKQSARVIKK